MPFDAKLIFIGIHMLCMLGAFGGMLIVQFGMPKDVRDNADVARSMGRLPILLITIGFLAGLVAYLLRMQYASRSGEVLPPVEHTIVGIKFMFLVAAGAFIGITSKSLKQANVVRANFFRLIALIAIILAACLGILL